jgi:AraC family transcriptional regulator of adaptative response/methylated-DNA-[protein]-cysteine methyltransferase
MPAMTARFGQARAGDLAQLVELLGILFAQEHELAPDAAKQERGLRLILENPAVGRIYVAREGARVLGTVSILRTVSTAEGGPAAHLEDFVVRPECRGRGIGTQLLAHAIAASKADGLLRLILLTDGDNASAQRLYARSGFARSGMLPMRLKLG